LLLGTLTLPAPAVARRPPRGAHRVRRARTAARTRGGTDQLVFAGRFRAQAKTTKVSGAPKVYASVQEYLEDVVSPLNDHDVREQFPEVKNRDAGRVEPEKHPVRVHAKLYAVRLEADKDFHCIIGDGESGPYITAEVSGLPRQGATTAFVGVRKQLRQLVGNSGIEEAKRRYHRPSPPIPVVVTGSLFYDAEHPPRSIGPNASGPSRPARKAVTQWEIHPVHTIVRDTAP
jgi:hypothetical protein